MPHHTHRRTLTPQRATVVELVATTRGRHTHLEIRAVRSGRVFFECNTTDLRGAELAVLTAERYCAERGLVLRMPADSAARASHHRSQAISPAA